MPDRSENEDFDESDYEAESTAVKRRRGSSSEPESAGLSRSGRPAQAEDDEGEEEGEDDDDADGYGDDSQVTGPSQSRSRNQDDGDDEGEDDDEEEEDEGARGKKPARKRRRREAFHRFLDTEAHVDEDDEVESDGEFEDEIHPDDAAETAGPVATDDRFHRQLDRERTREVTWDAEKQAEEFRRRYGRREKAVADTVIPRRILLPTPEDPSIWVIKCSDGKEKDVLYNIMKRARDRARTANPLRLVSVFFRAGVMGGHIYVEAHRKEDVLAALEDMPGVYMRSKFQLIELSDMPSLLRVTKKRAVEPGEFVRIKRGLYANDLAQVDDVDATTGVIRVRLVPRLTYGATASQNERDLERGKSAGAILPIAGPRPPQKMFNPHEVKASNAPMRYVALGKGRKEYHYMNDVYLDGFLVKNMRLNALQTDDVKPTLDEATFFAASENDGSEKLDLQALAASLRGPTGTAAFLPGDMVEIYKGEQQGLAGRVLDADQDVARVEIGPSANGKVRRTVVEVPVATIRKRFRQGDHVKVTAGSRYADEAGMVVRVSDDRVTLLLDSDQREMTVFSRDVRLAADASAAHMNSKYSLHELVQLNEATVGVVVKVDRDSVRVLDQEGSVRSVLMSELSHRVDNRNQAVATDREGAEVRVGDTVKEVAGLQRQGAVKFIHRHYLFVHTVTQLRDAGMFVARTIAVTTVAAKGGRIETGPDLTKMNPALMSRSGPGGGPGGSVPRFAGRDPIIGKKVRITRGSHKGLVGIAKDTTSTGVMVELHSRNKQIPVNREWLIVVDPTSGQPIDRRGPGTSRVGMPTSRPAVSRPLGSGGNSVWGGNPAPAGGATPAWGAPPPPGRAGWRPGGSSSVWGPSSGGRTPAPSGSRTPYAGRPDGSGSVWGGAGSGGRTPAPYGGQTPAPYGGQTPRPTAAATPADMAGYSAPTPDARYGFASAATPAGPGRREYEYGSGEKESGQAGLYPSAPTPGVFGAPTPGAVYEAETPGIWGAPTPGAGLGDDEDE